MSERITVYSCYFGAHEPLNPNAMGDWSGYEKILFTDDPVHQVDGARTEVVQDFGLGPAYLSRRPKLCPHHHIKGADWAIYVDNRASLTVAPQDIVDRINTEYGGEAPAGRYLFLHNKKCAYREMMRCKRRDLITEAQFSELYKVFEAQGFPERWGVFVNTIMIQKMGDAETDGMNEFWWEMFLRYAKRDQITLPFALWRTGYPRRVLPFGISDIARWPVFGRKDRIKFRDELKGKAAE
ncbi:hypothetical protein [Actibacterium pelagium]|uniref:Uncharacterized protein n=1 Tax=Actibacterium pelagium TaxID=2029103 RepID=A0A917EN41_9RHOB|nr:hypothetical protein [Actibacterium pelagium]GGE63116.1 hypothetical protein GCM10011517_33500 [Actibacterium pelagium]